ARLACHGHVATHHARELAGDGKAEPRAAVAARGERIGLGEILKQFRLLLRRHADAAIRNGKLDPVASVRHLAHPQGDLALFRELTGIAQQIEQNLLEPHGIHGQGAEILSASTTSRFWFCWASCLAVPTTYSISGAFSARLTRDARQGGAARTGQRLRYA